MLRMLCRRPPGSPAGERAFFSMKLPFKKFYTFFYNLWKKKKIVSAPLIPAGAGNGPTASGLRTSFSHSSAGKKKGHGPIFTPNAYGVAPYLRIQTHLGGQLPCLRCHSPIPVPPGWDDWTPLCEEARGEPKEELFQRKLGDEGRYVIGEGCAFSVWPWNPLLLPLPHHTFTHKWTMIIDSWPICFLLPFFTEDSFLSSPLADVSDSDTPMGSSSPNHPCKRTPSLLVQGQ